MKDDIRVWMQKNDPNNPQLGALLEYIYDYPPLEFTKEDFEKRRRIKNQVPLSERCMAKRANDEQCTRRKKPECDFCGTHAKGTPHGTVTDIVNTVITKNVELWIQEIKGINYYMDGNKNVYSTEDVIMGVPMPAIVGRAQVTENGSYSIPELGI
jgi:hypothetical protein